jgi:hypothetical protein
MFICGLKKSVFYIIVAICGILRDFVGNYRKKPIWPEKQARRDVQMLVVGVDRPRNQT